MNPSASPDPSPTSPEVALKHLRFTWDGSDEPDLTIDELRVQAGERLFVQGSSGSGKSTLLGLLAGITTPQAGTVRVRGEVLSAMSSARRDHFRADHIGYLFQMFNLIPYLTVTENVTLPLHFSKRRRSRVDAPNEEAARLLDRLGMAELSHRPVTRLSVGQQQRVAAARALIGTPEIILADEPTSSLDSDRSKGFVELLFEECRRAGATLVFVSHDTQLASLFDRTYRLGACS